MRRKSGSPDTGRSPRSFPTRSAAKSWARNLESKLERGEYADSEAERRTLADACDQYLKTHPDIASDHKRIVTWWRDNHGRRTLAKVTDALADADPRRARRRHATASGRRTSRRSASARRAPSTVSITYLRTVLSYCVEIGWMYRSPPVKKLTEGQRVRFLSDDELTALTRGAGGVRRAGDAAVRVLRDLLRCASGRAAEPGMEGCRLAKGVALIHKSKNSDGRKLYIRGQALDYLKAYGKVRDLHSPGVFLLNSGAPLTHSKYGKLFRDACTKAGIKRFPVPRPAALLRDRSWRRTARRCSRSSRCSGTARPR